MMASFFNIPVQRRNYDISPVLGAIADRMRSIDLLLGVEYFVWGESGKSIFSKDDVLKQYRITIEVVWSLNHVSMYCSLSLSHTLSLAVDNNFIQQAAAAYCDTTCVII